MHKSCARGKGSGGKGNQGMFIERDTKVCAAGLPSSQPDIRVADCFSQYSLQDEVDSLISDAIIPPPKQRLLPPLRHPPKLDRRNAGIFTQVSEVVNPSNKTKFSNIVEDIKNTAYSSYWKKPLGTIPDPVPRLPEGLDIYKTTFGKKTPHFGHLYDIVMPSHAGPDLSSDSKKPGYHTRRTYSEPPYNPNKTYGMKYKADVPMKCCLTDDRQTLGTARYSPMTTKQAEFQCNKPRLGQATALNDNISVVPPGFAFGKIKPPDSTTLPQCLTNCELNAGKYFFLKCLAHLNSLRKCLSKRYDGPFYAKLYLNLKHFDNFKTGWLPKQVVYEFSATKRIKFNPTFLEPLLAAWNVFDGSQVEYKTFVHVLNYREPMPELPKVSDVAEECIDFQTTYSEMVNPNQKPDLRLLAGLPSGRYMDMDYPVTPNNCCKAIRSYLPEESDAMSCLCPSVVTLYGVSHRDMYAIRTPEVVKRVFTAGGVKLTEKKFDAVWEAAKKYHSQGLVSYETFKRALNEIKVNNENISSN